MQIAERQQSSSTHSGEQAHIISATSIAWAIAFGLAFIVLFLTTDRTINNYDQGITLTAGLRVSLGQIPYRDFYFNYGAGQAYIYGALFKLFGLSYFAAFILDILIKSLVCATFFVALRRYCRFGVASALYALLLLWLFVLQLRFKSDVTASLFMLWAVLSVQPVFTRAVSLRRFALTGVLIGLTALFRPDCGMALLVAILCLPVIASFVRPSSAPRRWREILRAMLAVVAGVAIIVVPPLIAYHAVAPWHDIAFDLFEFAAKYYRAGRGLPLLRRGDLGRLGELFFVLPPVTVLLAGVVSLRFLSRRSRAQTVQQENPSESATIGFLISFGLVAVLMYVKSIVRVELTQDYLAVVPTLLILGVLLDRISRYSLLLKGAIVATACIWLLALLQFAGDEVHAGLKQKSFVLAYLLRPQAQAPLPPDQDWCRLGNPATTHLCFLENPDHIHAIEFLAGRIPPETLYVGLRHHDRVYANDNMTYVILDRLPATKWSHMDPDLQNSAGIQREMIAEFEAKQPPYIVLDSEYEHFHEPNDSSKSSGVYLLDQYIQQHYHLLREFGSMSVWQRDSSFVAP